MQIHQFDAIVIGAGQGGTLAVEFAKAGKRTALIEKGPVGGTCINVGCTPTKTLVASARVAALARRGAEYGVSIDHISIDWQKVRQRKQAVVDDFRSHYEQNLAKIEGLEVLHGGARFVEPGVIEVALHEGEMMQLQAPLIVIATGTRSVVPSIHGLDAVTYLDSTSVMELDRVPEHLLVLGGGVIAVEFGQLFRRLGARVTIIEKGGQLLPREDADVADCVAEFFQEDGIEILLNAQVGAVRQVGENIEIELEQGGEPQRLSGSHLLVATGRRPNTDTLNLACAGIEIDEKGFVRVDENLRASAKGVYALGDVAGTPQFTHMAYDDFRILRDALLHGHERSTRDRLVPYVVFTDPQLGRVGLTEHEAKKLGLEFYVATLAMSQVARPIETGETRGLWKALVEKKTGKILGAAFLSVDGGETIATLQMAMAGGLKCEAIRDMPLSHPTLSEALNNLFIMLDKQLEENGDE